MKVLVCGGRDYNDFNRVCQVLDFINKTCEIERIIHGAARGADSLGGTWSESRGIPCDVFRADWEKFGKAAGPIRNQQMLLESKPDLVVAFPGGSGTAHMVRISKEQGVKVYEVKS